MENLSLSQIKKRLSSEDRVSLPHLGMVVLRNVTIEPIEFYLRYPALEMGFDADVRFGEYDNIIQEAVGGQGEIITGETDYVLVFMQLETLSSSLVCDYASLSMQDVEAEKLRIENHISSVAHGIRKQTDAVVLWHSFELPLYPALGVVDAQTADGQTELIMELNRVARSALKEIGNAYVVDMNLCVTRLGANEFYDRRYWHIARSPYSRSALAEIAREDFKVIRALRGKNRKCVVLDCDNVLWGGVVGEDGLSGIKLGQTYPGSFYCEAQREIVSLYNRGVIIALCSKNNEDDVWEVFRKHPDMVLEEKHIAAYEINWENKAANLRRLASSLNIGLDSIVFVDDSEQEVALIRQSLPEVETIHFLGEGSVGYSDMLTSCGLFDTLTFSAEDKKRGEMYKSEAARKNLAVKSIDMESYYESLEMMVSINLADDFSIPRIAQLTQKTNQFNLTTKRYSESDIKAFMERGQSDVIYLRLEDRFGDMGIVGVCVIVYEGETAIFDTFLLSCRSLGRKVEDVFLTHCLKLSQMREAHFAIGEYLPTNKNMQTRDFYLDRGFERLESNGSGYIAKIDLATLTPWAPDFFKTITADFG